MRLMIADDVKKMFKGLTVAALIIRDVNQSSPNIDEFNKVKYAVISKIRNRYPDQSTLVKDPMIRVYRNFYWKQIGLDPTKIRPASEALIRRIINGDEIPSINPVVDAYNLASIETGLPMSAYDLESIKGELVVRFSSPGEKFQAIGWENEKSLERKLLVLSDEEGIISLYPYRDAVRSRVRDETRSIILVVYGVAGIQRLSLLYGLKKACKYIRLVVGGSVDKLL